MYLYSPIVIKVPYFHIYIYIYYWFFKLWNHRLPLLLLLIDWIGYIWSWVPISQLPNTDKPPPSPIIGYKRKFTPLSQPKNPSASPKNMKITRIYSPPNPIYTIPHSSLKHSSSHRKKSIKALARAKVVLRMQKHKNSKDDYITAPCSIATPSTNTSTMAEDASLIMPVTSPWGL